MDKKEKISIIEKRLQELREEKEALLQEASEIEGEYLHTYEVRPAGRVVLTLGEELIQDPIAAILELVKNCYDADSRDALISFHKKPSTDCLEIRIEDHGHGMSPDDIINKWLVPSTDDKNNRRKSPNGRIMQGRKGIGRYAASILGDQFSLRTVDSSGTETCVSLRWSEFKRYKYLDQIQIPIQISDTSHAPGTSLSMYSVLGNDNIWTKDYINKLVFELKKLVHPVLKENSDSGFEIILTIEDDAAPQEKRVERIEPYPIQDYFDYRINGSITKEGQASLTFENRKIKNSMPEYIHLAMNETGCGALSIDIRVYDREANAIDSLIMRGLQKTEGAYLSRIEARQLLNEYNGIGVYRNGFRIRPLGDPDYDWLELNKKRIQNPAMRIGSNQVIGYVHIESEELSGLEEKSARDGLKDNSAYNRLIDITNTVIGELEQRRYVIRRKLGLLNSSRKLERQLEGLYDYGPLKRTVSSILKKSEISQAVVEEINNIITAEENKKNEAIEEIRKAVAVYQGQATLGKIINVILHEGRRPLNYIKNQYKNLQFYSERFEKKHDLSSCNEIVTLSTGISENAQIFADLFGRLDPLAAKKRGTRRKLNLSEVIKRALSVFEKEIEAQKIETYVHCPENIHYLGWYQDFYAIFVNLIDNSIYWLAQKDPGERKILFEVQETNRGFCLDYRDSGPGISVDLLESGVIFEPEFSTKPQDQGTGLGLSIAGEAATRNNMTLTAVQSNNGAHFVLITDE